MLTSALNTRVGLHLTSLIIQTSEIMAGHKLTFILSYQLLSMAQQLLDYLPISVNDMFNSMHGPSFAPMSILWWAEPEQDRC